MTRDEIFTRLLVDQRFEVEFRDDTITTGRTRFDSVFATTYHQYAQCLFTAHPDDLTRSIVARTPLRGDGYRLSLPYQRGDRVRLFLDYLENLEPVAWFIRAVDTGQGGGV